jgi:hypothetical protein
MHISSLSVEVLSHYLRNRDCYYKLKGGIEVVLVITITLTKC